MTLAVAEVNELLLRISEEEEARIAVIQTLCPEP
jgi:hypothetical protein